VIPLLPRHLTPALLAAAEQLPIVSLTGPRQSGKTTLAKMAFPGHSYINLEAPEVGEAAREDPRGFLRRLPGPAIIDEAQRAPELFSYLQLAVDEDETPGRFILTGSQNFLLSERISQTLAGRCAILNLLPFSVAELEGRPARDPFEALQGSPAKLESSLDELLFRGLYPRVHRPKMDARSWLADYVATYVERDVRLTINIGQLDLFQRFLKLAAGRTATVLNLSNLARDVGVSPPTIRNWLSVLEASFIIKSLPPYFESFNKRLVKSPKIHFIDTGMLCFLLGIRKPSELEGHPLRGAIFESFVVAEFTKAFLNAGEVPPLYHWRDHGGHEVDLVVDRGRWIDGYEVKSSETIRSSSFSGLSWWREIIGERFGRGGLVFGGTEALPRGEFTAVPWNRCS